MVYKECYKARIILLRSNGEKSNFSYEVIWDSEEKLDNWYGAFRRGDGWAALPCIASRDYYEIRDPDNVRELMPKGTRFVVEKIIELGENV